MAELPYMNAYGLIERILGKVKEASTPEKFTQDFLATRLGFPGGSARAAIPLLKRIGLISTDGTPTELYRQFRGGSARTSMAAALRKAFGPLFERNEYAHSVDSQRLRSLIVEATGLEADSSTARAIAGTFEAFKPFADFEAADDVPQVVPTSPQTTQRSEQPSPPPQVPAPLSYAAHSPAVGLGISYTINLNLPETADVAVFNAIFKALQENLLRR